MFWVFWVRIPKTMVDSAGQILPKKYREKTASSSDLKLSGFPKLSNSACSPKLL